MAPDVVQEVPVPVPREGYGATAAEAEAEGGGAGQAGGEEDQPAREGELFKGEHHKIVHSS